MEIPYMQPIPTRTVTVDRFGGLNRTPRAQEGEFSRMENLSGDRFPLLSSRERRGLHASPASPQGLISKEQLCYVDGADFLLGDQRIEMGLSTHPEDCPKQLVSMGAFVIILPDRMYINTADPRDWGCIEAEYVAKENIRVCLCRQNGEALEPGTIGIHSPDSPENGDLWLDTTEDVLKQWDGSGWVQVVSTCLRLECSGIGRDFAPMDGIEISGSSEISLNGANTVWARGDDHIVITGLIPPGELPPGLTLRRAMPLMDHVVEAGNRLWGCRYGYDRGGELVNRIYASALGDFKNWTAFRGVSTDSYYANVGSDGPFTGAVNYLGEALFFKENCLHRVWGSYPGEFRVLHHPCRGVEQGSAGSLAIVGENLYYKSPGAICLYDGSTPRVISGKLGSLPRGPATAGCFDSLLYLCLQQGTGHEILVYDTRRDLWHREDDLYVTAFCTHRNALYAIDGRNRQILRLRGEGESWEASISWSATTSDLALEDPGGKYLTRILLRVLLEPGSRLDIGGEYDRSGEFLPLCVIQGSHFRSFTVPLRPRRCDHLRLKFSGRGQFRLYSITRILEGGLDP